ncbi:MAG: hypothetical protein FWG45_04550 [Oscillospiraceae bacterium]|nr:hypothetical protein [Oscillospiraceae bacterium]
MKSYFHCDANIYRRKIRRFFEYTAAPAVFVVVFLTLCLLLSFRNLMNSGILLPAAAIIGGVVLLFAIIVRVMLEVSEHFIRTHSKYTYVEIGLKDVIVSVYAGRYPEGRERIVLRELFIIPLNVFVSAQAVGTQRKGRSIIIKAQGIRAYVGKSSRLGYTFKEGELIFKEFFYNEAGYKRLDKMFIPRQFENIDEIIRSIYAAKENFDNLPPAPEYVFKESAYVIARKKRDKDRRLRGF